MTQFSRDIVKNCVCGTDDEADYMVLGIETQAHVDEFMPARVMIYDAMTLHTQIEFLKAQHWPKWKDRFLSGVPKHTKLKPVITVVCYFGTQPSKRRSICVKPLKNGNKSYWMKVMPMAKKLA